MTTLHRSSTTRTPKAERHLRDESSAHVPLRGLRLRSTSFTQSILRRQRSESHFTQPPGTFIGASNRRRPSFESRTLVSSPTEMVSSAPVECTSSGGLLTVNDSVSGGGAASSIDSGSEDEREGASIKDSGVNVSMSEPDHEEHQQAMQRRSMAETFRDKLHISRKSATTFGAKRSKSIFGRRTQHKNNSAPLLYDDGSNSTYPPPQPRDDTTAERDQYGFVKGSQWLSVEEHRSFERIYQPIANRRLQKWRQMISENNGEWPARSSKLKRYIRKGIPSEIRGQAWFYYSGAQAKFEANRGVYQEYVQKAEQLGLQNEFLDVIERDLHRTFPDNIRFKSTAPRTSNSHSYDDVPAIQALRRILSAFSVYSPNIGYCQSLNYIAGFLLLFMNEEEAFWTFVTAIHDILPPSVYDVTMEGANIDQTVLMMLLSERCPQIWNRLGGGRSFWECEQAEANGLPTTSLVTSHWFLTLFINILPTESVLRVWDCLFYEGQHTIFRVALAIFKMNEHEILAVNDSLEIFQVVQNMPKRMIDCHALMDATYNKYGSLTRTNQQDLDRRRAIFKTRREERRKKLPAAQTTKLKRSTVRGTIIHKAMEARRLVERAKTVRR
ncbi:hypothetical protein VTP01DRAFT_5660 [Rhizomucor pusillus]|uniref:uncharacterized protein n=1 Tax=Rhizomucor pusillus TaxID=4840 RepID=UPI0037448F4C